MSTELQWITLTVSIVLVLVLFAVVAATERR